MDPKRLAWIRGIAERVPRLLDAIRAGNHWAEYPLGERRIDGRRVRLTLRAAVVEGAPVADDGDPLAELIELPAGPHGAPLDTGPIAGARGPGRG